MHGASGLTHGTRALLSARACLTLVFCLCVRASQLFATEGGARSAGWRLLLAAFVVGDVVAWLGLRRTEHFLFWPRLAWVVADVAVWCAAPYPSGLYDLAVLPGAILAAEAGLRRSPRGLLVVVASLVAAMTVRLSISLPVLPLTVGWQVFGFGIGLASALYDGRLQRQAEGRALQRRSAECRRARLAGQNDVAMGVDTANDKLGQIRPLLGRPEPETALWTVLDGYKATLREHTQEIASYLSDVVMAWAKEHNTHPDLSADVVPHVPEGIGTTILTAEQAVELRSALERRGLRGPVRVELAPQSGPRVPGSPLELVVGSEPLRLARDQRRPLAPFDPGPLVFLMGAFWMFRSGTRANEGVPGGVVALLVLAFLVAGWIFQRRLRAVGAPARRGLVACAVLLALIQAAMATSTMTKPWTVSGHQSFPATHSLAVLALLAGLYHDELSSRARLALVAAIGAVAGTGLVLLHPPYRLPDLMLGSVAWPLTAYIPTRALNRQLKVGAETLDQEWADQDAAAAAQAFQEGRVEVIDLAESALADAVQRSARVLSSLDEPLRNHLQEQLEEVRSCLRDLRAGESSSSMTVH